MATDAASTETTATVLRATAGQVRLQLEGGREVTKRVTVPISARETLVGTAVPVTVTGSGDKARVDLAENWLDAAAPATKAPARRRRARTGGDDEPTAATPAPKRRRGTPVADDDDAAKAKPARKPRAKKASPAEAEVATPGDAVDADAPKRRTRGGKAAAAAEPAQAEVAPVEVAPSDVDGPEAAVEAATPGEAPSIAEEPRSRRSRSRSRGGRAKKSAPEAAIAESPAKADAAAVEAPADAAPTPPAAVAPPAVAPLDPEVVDARIAAAVELVRAARAA